MRPTALDNRGTFPHAPELLAGQISASTAWGERPQFLGRAVRASIPQLAYTPAPAEFSPPDTDSFAVGPQCKILALVVRTQRWEH